MLKTVMLVSALAISAPAFAQELVPAGRVPQTTTAMPPTSAETVVADQTQIPAATPAEGTPTADAVTALAEQSAATPVTPPATPVAAPADQAVTATSNAPVTGATQIAQVVDTEFPAYDKNADTNLDKTEFSAWMVALKMASEPATKAGDPATVKWVDGAFASADLDKSSVVSKAELTAYLSGGAE